MGKHRSFRDDEQIGKKLEEIPKNERSTIIRMALRYYFEITDSVLRTKAIQETKAAKGGNELNG